MSEELCKGGCGKNATYKGWCSTKWISGRKFGVDCEIIRKKIAEKISNFRKEEAKLGKNPMQNPVICAKNHSPGRNKKAADSLKKLGQLGLLPQQIESEELKEKRRQNNKKAQQELLRLGKHPRQTESSEKRRKRIEKALNTFHSTKWKQFYYKELILRSSWEKIVAEYLDSAGYKWEYETLRVYYFDTQTGKQALTIPDFYLPKLNIVIEVKGREDPRQTEDKIKGLISAGYKAFVFRKMEIKMIRNHKSKLTQLLLGEYNEKS